MPITLQQMQETNRKLHRLLELMQIQESGPLRLDATDLTGLSAELRKVAQHRVAGTKDGDASLATEFAEYRKNLEALNATVPRLQARYLAERARLQRDHTHLNAASGWAQSREMLYRR